MARNAFRDIVFDWLESTFDESNVVVKSRALALVRIHDAYGHRWTNVQVRTSFVCVNGVTVNCESPVFFDDLKSLINKAKI